jgi:hypothetical protein
MFMTQISRIKQILSIVRQNFIDYYPYLEGVSINLSSLCHFLLLPDEFASAPTS